MSMRKREKIQKLLRTKIIVLLFVCCSAFTYEGFGVYAHFSPSLQLAEHWMEYVDKYPAYEYGLGVELPGPASFRWWFEGSYVPFPNGGPLRNGDAMWLGVGIMLHKEITQSFDALFGPQVILGRVYAKGTYDWEESDSVRHLIDFDGKGTGIGIGVNGGVLFGSGDFFKAGVMASVIYFGVSANDVPIFGKDYYNPGGEIDSSFYDYNSEYISLSMRIILGLDF